MRIMITAVFPTDVFNEAVRDGSVGAKIGRIVDEVKPETIFFSDTDGMRSAILTVNLDQESSIPRLAEPFFLLFEAEIQIKIVMTPEDLMKSGLDSIGKKWSS